MHQHEVSVLERRGDRSEAGRRVAVGFKKRGRGSCLPDRIAWVTLVRFPQRFESSLPSTVPSKILPTSGFEAMPRSRLGHEPAVPD